jgi:hypothetical protein
VFEGLGQRLHVLVFIEPVASELRFRMQREQNARCTVVRAYARLRVDHEYALIHLRDHEPIDFELVFEVAAAPGSEPLLYREASRKQSKQSGDCKQRRAVQARLEYHRLLNHALQPAQQRVDQEDKHRQRTHEKSRDRWQQQRGAGKRQQVEDHHAAAHAATHGEQERNHDQIDRQLAAELESEICTGVQGENGQRRGEQEIRQADREQSRRSTFAAVAERRAERGDDEHERAHYQHADQREVFERAPAGDAIGRQRTE